MVKSLIVLSGLPGSGKSTWSQKYLQENPRTIWINRDHFRLMANGPFGTNEDFVKKLEQHAIYEAAKLGYNIIVDSVNFDQGRLQDAIQFMTENMDYSMVQIQMSTPLEVCIARDSNRIKPVGEAVIREMYEKYKDSHKISTLLSVYG